MLSTKALSALRATVKSPRLSTFAPKASSTCHDSFTSNAVTLPIPVVAKSFFSSQNEKKMVSDDFASEADYRNQGNEPSKDVPQGVDPRSWFTDGDEQNRNKPVNNEDYKKVHKDNTMPYFDKDEIDQTAEKKKESPRPLQSQKQTSYQELSKQDW